MDETQLKRLMEEVRCGTTAIDEAVRIIKRLPFEDIGFAKLDTHRTIRKGFAEVVFCQGKTIPQIVQIVGKLIESSPLILASRADPAVYPALCEAYPKYPIQNFSQARIVAVGETPKLQTDRPVALVITAGTADIPVAEEAVATAQLLGCPVGRLYDVGVAGLHRLLSHLEEIQTAKLLIVVAGMEGALASVIAGLAQSPVIAVPTSVGYGANFGGLSALLSMLNVCSPGVTTVNIDNGFGAGYYAALLWKTIQERTD